MSKDFSYQLHFTKSEINELLSKFGGTSDENRAYRAFFERLFYELPECNVFLGSNRYLGLEVFDIYYSHKCYTLRIFSETDIRLFKEHDGFSPEICDSIDCSIYRIKKYFELRRV